MGCKVVAVGRDEKAGLAAVGEEGVPVGNRDKAGWGDEEDCGAA